MNVRVAAMHAENPRMGRVIVYRGRRTLISVKGGRSLLEEARVTPSKQGSEGKSAEDCSGCLPRISKLVAITDNRSTESSVGKVTGRPGTQILKRGSSRGRGRPRVELRFVMCLRTFEYRRYARPQTESPLLCSLFDAGVVVPMLRMS